jgi:hypothetical protein
MADNFNLRTFLSENKLTKNAQLLNENTSERQEVYYDDGLFNIQAKYPNLETAIQGVKQYLDRGNGLVTFDQWEKAEVDHLNFDGPCYFLVGPDEEPGQHPPLLVSVRDEDLITDPETVAQYKADDEAGFSDEDELDEEAPSSMQAGFDSVNLEKKKHAEMMRVANKLFPEFGGNLENFKPLSSQQRELVYQNIDPANIMEQTILTANERRLVEMVNSAMREDNGYATHDGSFGGDDSEENVDYTMGRHDDPNQLPNPAPELNIPEGEDMVQEKPMPKYESIDQLMKEIEHGTNEAAHKYKMEEMKRIYELLETKVSSLEEGENAEHIDQKKVKQMRKDIAALRKAEERLRKDFDKKFSGKEKEAAPKKEKEVVALAEGNFDLRKFLVENRK